jgi:hypothetical protein
MDINRPLDKGIPSLAPIMTYHVAPDGQSTYSGNLIKLPEFLRDVKEAHDLVRLLDRSLFINPSDFFALVDCETRLRGYSYDRAVSLCIFMSDFYHEVVFRLDSDESRGVVKGVFEQIIWSTIEHYQRPDVNQGVLANALYKLGDLGCTALVHECFESKFRQWRQMIRSARRMPAAKNLQQSAEYGALCLGVLVADRVGNMLSHVRHIYCDQAFEGNLFTFD